ncbi:MAG: DUF5916 domain-containing protein [Pyrinomonadaceae bacterium]
MSSIINKIILMLAFVLLSAPVVRVRAQASVNQTPQTSTETKTETRSGNDILSDAKTGATALPPEKHQPVRLVRFEQPPVIDGKLDDEVWKQAARIKDFLQVQPGDNIAPSKPSEVLIGYDSKFLYFGLHAFDDPAKVRATIARRDGIFNDDYIGFTLDTFNDQRRAYQMFFNALGVQADGVRTEGSGEDFSVDLVMESKGVMTDDGYTVEVAIPFKSLRYEAGKGKIWGAHFFRKIQRFNGELDSWMPLSRNQSGTLNQEGRLTGFEGISTERTLELIPSLTLSETGRRRRAQPPCTAPNDTCIPDAGRMVNGPVKFDPGLTGKFSLTPTVTLDFAVNPDFAQVEADQTIVTANQRFPIFFEEKRPFFLEGVDIFDTPLDTLNTRAIVDPDYAVKLTGKRGRNTFGLLLASDNAPGNFSEEDRADPPRFPRQRPFADFVGKNAAIGVFRLKRDVGKDSNIGMIATTYNFIERRNNLGGVDGRFRVSPQAFFNFQVVGTASRRFFRDADLGQNTFRSGNGFGYFYRYDFTRRNYGYQLQGSGRTRDYRADVGFTPRTNTNQENFFLRYSTDPNPKARLISWRVTNGLSAGFDFQGRSQRFDLQPQVNFSLQRQTNIGFGFRKAYERIFEEEFGTKRTAPCVLAGNCRAAFAGDDAERSTYKTSFIFFGNTRPSQKYSANFRVVLDRHVFDFDFGAGARFPRVSPAALRNPTSPLDPGAGNLLNIDAEIEYKPTAALRASLEYTKSKLRRVDTNRIAFDENIFALRTTYQFSRFTSVRARVDYDTLQASLRAQLLLGYTPGPGTAFFLGYNDDLQRNGFSPFTGQLEPGLRRNGRTFFIKMSYLFRRSFG